MARYSLLLLVTFVALVAISCGLKIPFKDCGSKDGKPNFVDITPCAKFPCVVQHKHNYSIAIDLDSKVDTKTVTSKVYGIISGIPVPFPISQPDACTQGIKCPVHKGDHDLFNSTLYVEPSYPNINVIVEWELVDDAKNYMACVQFPLSVLN